MPPSESSISFTEPRSDTTLLEIDQLVRSATTEPWKYVPNQSAENSEQCRDTRYNVENPQ